MNQTGLHAQGLSDSSAGAGFAPTTLTPGSTAGMMGPMLEQIAQVRSVLTPDLLHPRYRDQPKAHCYAASEALAHLLRPDHRVEVFRLRTSPTVVHWYLRVDDEWVDPTADQFPELPAYGDGTRCGFLTRLPSKRAAEIIRRVHASV